MIQPVNNNTGLYAGAGLGAGLVGGAAYGYFSKPFLKSGEVTDTFVAKYADTVIKEEIKEALTITKHLKKILDTGSIDEIPEDILKEIDDNGTDLKSMAPEARKAYAQSIVQEGYNEYGVDSWDDLVKKSKEEAAARFTDNRIKAIAEYDNLLFADGTKPEVMKERLTKNAANLYIESRFERVPLKEAIDALVDGKSVKEVNEYILNVKEFEQSCFTRERKQLKEGLTEYLTGKKTGGGTFIDLATQEGKNAAKRVDKLVRKIKLGAAAKWAAIGGGALALTGAIAAMFTGNKKV